MTIEKAGSQPPDPPTSEPSIKWDGKTWFVSLPTDRGVVDARWNQPVTFVVRIREKGTEQWSVGFETPLTSCSFVDLKPDTEYEMEVTSKNDVGASEPLRSTIRTKPLEAENER